EYRTKFPNKAITTYPHDGPNPAGLAVLFGGGSMPDVRGVDEHLLAVIPTLTPLESADQFALADPGNNYLVYNRNRKIRIDLSAAQGSFAVHWIDPSSFAMTDGQEISGGKTVDLESPSGHSAAIVWLTRK